MLSDSINRENLEFEICKKNRGKRFYFIRRSFLIARATIILYCFEFETGFPSKFVREKQDKDTGFVAANNDPYRR